MRRMCQSWARAAMSVPDRHGIVWQLNSYGYFLGNGDGSGRWLEL